MRSWFLGFMLHMAPILCHSSNSDIQTAADNLKSKPFVVGDLNGQLGNQFFIIAATISLALDNDAIPVFPDLVGLNNYNLPLNREKFFPHLNTKIPGQCQYTYVEPHYHYAKIPYVANMKIHGLFQSEKHFVHHKQEILDTFAPSDEIMQYLTENYSDVLIDPNTVSIHIRFFHEDPEGKFHPCVGREFIEKAIALFPEDAHFIVFSNHMGRCCVNSCG